MIMQSEQKNSISKIATGYKIGDMPYEYEQLSIRNPWKNNINIKGCVVTFDNKYCYPGCSRKGTEISICDEHYILTEEGSHLYLHYISLNGRAEEKLMDLNAKCDMCKMDRDIGNGIRRGL